MTSMPSADSQPQLPAERQGIKLPAMTVKLEPSIEIELAHTGIQSAPFIALPSQGGLLVSVRRSIAYGAVGLALGLGAPIGSLLFRQLIGLTTGPLVDFEANRFFYLYLAVGTSIVFTSFGFVLGLLADRLVAANAKLQGLAVTDSLTSLRNSRYFNEVLPLETARADRQNQSLGLVVIDLDNFKRINDRLGHAAGDRALVHFASILVRSIRKVDIPCRIGGEEFGVICPGAGLEDTRRVAERILTGLKEHPFSQVNLPERLTASAGVAVHSFEQDHKELFLAADTALYMAKKSGKDQVAPARQSIAESERAITGTDRH
jgi:diguanylate cyclase (GGDEF)-like protein